MLPYTGDYTEQRKSGKSNFTYYSFTPRPLKGAELYKLDDELVALLIEAHHNLGTLKGIIQYAPNKSSFSELMLLKECSYSMMIDYDAPDFTDVLISRGTGRDNIEPITNLKKAYGAASNMLFSAQDYSKICDIALYGDNSEQQISIRDTQTFLHNAISNLKTYNPTAPEALLPALADISTYIFHSNDDVLIQAALAHYQFEMIHPFEKYNGVVGRILVSMILQKTVGEALPLLCLSEYLYFNKNEYFDLLSTTQYSGGYIRWIKFCVRIINEAAKNGAIQLREYEEVIKSDEKLLNFTISPTKSIWAVYNYLKDYPITSISTAQKQTNLSYNSILKALTQLQKSSIVTKESDVARNRVWTYVNIGFALKGQVLHSNQASLSKGLKPNYG